VGLPLAPFPLERVTKPFLDPQAAPEARCAAVNLRLADNPGTISPCDLGARCLTATTCKACASSPGGQEQRNLAPIGPRPLCGAIIHAWHPHRILAPWLRRTWRCTGHSPCSRHHPYVGVVARDRSGKVAKWYGTNTDLEERKRAEDALRKSEERYPIPGISELCWSLRKITIFAGTANKWKRVARTFRGWCRARVSHRSTTDERNDSGVLQRRSSQFDSRADVESETAGGSLVS
jgi:hypothetical protein